MLQQFNDLMANVRHDNRYHSIRDLVEPDDPEVKEIAEVLMHADDFVAAAQDFVDSFTTYRRELGDYWSKPSELLEERAGDCITGDTPVWIRRNGAITLVEIRELLFYGNYMQFVGLDILTPDGFKPLISVRRKNPRPTLRIMTTSDVGFTAAHRLLVQPNFHQSGRYGTVSSIDSHQIIRVYPELGAPPFTANPYLDYELGWAWGLFFADGSSSIRKIKTLGGESWRIVNSSVDYLERAAAAFENQFPNMVFSPKRYSSYERGSLVKSSRYTGQRIKNLYCLDVLLKIDSQKGVRANFVRNFRTQIYNAFGIKKVPDFILHGSREIIAGFLDGVSAGDGEKDGIRISSHHKLSTFGLASLIHKLGRIPYISPDHGSARVHSIEHPREYQKNWRVPGGNEEVFDIATETGEFVAADVASKNCDDKAILLLSLLLNDLPAEKVFAAFGFWSQNGKREGHMWVVMDSGNEEDRIIEATASSAKKLKGTYHLEAIFNDKYTFAYPEAIKDFNLLTEKMEKEVSYA